MGFFLGNSYICYDAYPRKADFDMLAGILEREGFEKRSNSSRYYFHADVPAFRTGHIDAVLARYRIRHRKYDNVWERSDYYRKIFFENNTEPFRCAYCHRRLTRDTLQVDHIVPVAKAKSSAAVRKKLKKRGITNINDPRNLVAACPKCNARKKDRMGSWVIRGRLGRHEVYWAVRRTVIITLLVLLLWLAVHLGIPQHFAGVFRENGFDGIVRDITGHIMDIVGKIPESFRNEAALWTQSPVPVPKQFVEQL